MKKIIIIVMALCILVGGVGGYAYAQTTHQSVQGSKIVGFAPYDTSANGLQEFDAIFGYSNPDCKNSITIKQISIIRADGEVVYEIYPNTILEPHQTRVIMLSQCGIPVPPSLPDPDVGTTRFYTVEVSWYAKGMWLPLIGTVPVFQQSYDNPSDTTPTLSKTRTNMINY